MDNTDQNYEAFLEALVKMADLCCDAMTGTRLESYWELLGPDVTLEEWHYACWQAMKRETFHKVPMPGQLMDYVREYRQQRQDEARDRKQRQRLLAEPPMSPEELQVQMRALYEQLEKPGKTL